MTSKTRLQDSKKRTFQDLADTLSTAALRAPKTSSGGKNGCAHVSCRPKASCTGWIGSSGQISMSKRYHSSHPSHKQISPQCFGNSHFNHSDKRSLIQTFEPKSWYGAAFSRASVQLTLDNDKELFQSHRNYSNHSLKAACFLQ
jgi:hypothetical protein